MCDNGLLFPIVEVEEPQIPFLGFRAQFEEVLRDLPADFIILDWRGNIAELTYSDHQLLLRLIVKKVEEFVLIDDPLIQGQGANCQCGPWVYYGSLQAKLSYRLTNVKRLHGYVSKILGKNQ